MERKYIDIFNLFHALDHEKKLRIEKYRFFNVYNNYRVGSL